MGREYLRLEAKAKVDFETAELGEVTCSSKAQGLCMHTPVRTLA